MTTLPAITPHDAARALRDGATLIDIREADEYAREHAPGAVSIPLSRLEAGHVALDARNGPVVFHCRSGMRTGANCARLSALVEGQGFLLEGGLDAWKRAGLPVETDARAPLEINRQVQLTAGAIVLLGALAALFVNPAFAVVPAAIGAGLTFAGASGWCGMAKLLAQAPWNRRAA